MQRKEERLQRQTGNIKMKYVRKEDLHVKEETIRDSK